MVRSKIPRDFFLRYSQGDAIGALQCVLNDPAVEFDAIAGGDPQSQAILSYADSLAFSNVQGALHTGAFLARFWKAGSPALSFDRSLMEIRGRKEVWEHFLFRAEDPADSPTFRAIRLWTRIESGQMAWEAADNLSQDLQGMTQVDRSLLALQMQFSGIFRSFWKRHPSLYEALGFPDRSHAICRRIPDPASRERLHQECRQIGAGLPVIFMEGFDLDWREMLEPFRNRPALFLFRDAFTLGHCLSIPAITETLHEPAHGLLVLDRYPNTQLKAQPQIQIRQRPLLPAVLWDQRSYLDRLPLFLRALDQTLMSFSEKGGEESYPANWLYQLGLGSYLAQNAHRLGTSRYPYLQIQKILETWNDPHKGRLPQGAEMGPEMPDLLGRLLAELPPAPARRSPSQKRKLRLAHITAQVVDGSHAPSRLIRTLMRNHCRSTFDLSLLITEGFVLRPNEYPMRLGHSAPSTERGSQTLKAFREAGVDVTVADPGIDFRETAQFIAQKISHEEIDVAVFHGPDFIHHAIAALSDVSLKVLFEHGSLPGRSGFDIAVSSAESAESVERLKPLFAAMGTELVRNPHVVDARESWERDPYPLSAFGLPEDALVLTTISNHLEHRLSESMCRAIVEILKRCPKAYYAPMGPTRPDSKVLRFFAGTEVSSRVRFLGTTACPSQCARSMHVYLNEYPFGSGIALLDALAAGCPVVSMHDENGPAQAKYAAIYYGMERMVRTLDPADYVNLACSLLNHPEIHREWRDAAIHCYEKHTDVEGYVRRLEEIVIRGLACR
jgi:hypothetical protein